MQRQQPEHDYTTKQKDQKVNKAFRDFYHYFLVLHHDQLHYYDDENSGNSDDDGEGH